MQSTAIRSLLTLTALAGATLAGTAEAQSGNRLPVQTVYALTNDANANEVVVGAAAFGQLMEIGRYATGGAGTGGGLGSQGSLAQSGNRLLAVNAGSDELTLFRTSGRFGARLTQQDLVSSGGSMPTSVAIRGNLAYVLNAGSDNVSGFRIQGNTLSPIATYSLSGSGVAAAQVDFSPNGNFVIVTERATNQILTYPVQGDGSLGALTINASAAPTPFGFQFRNDGVLIVSEANGGTADQGFVSSYQLNADGTLTTITGAAATQETAACWIANTNNGRFSYTTNTASGTVTGFSVGSNGALTLLDSDGITGDLGTGARPIDFDFDRTSRVLFVLDSGNDQVVAFYRGRDGSLLPLTGTLNLPDGAAGLLAN